VVEDRSATRKITNPSVDVQMVTLEILALRAFRVNTFYILRFISERPTRNIYRSTLY